ncbi:MAG: (Fe-S)-binding protein [Gammaproteobacteria bacterium]|nr:(Fe-S)-binding protein [Gammaproteobacteria bacterium]MBI5616727.1 (Fe-S)-binding protein [Gammaproteobacteria bacterium]
MPTDSPTLPLLAAFSRELYHCSDCSYCVDAVWAARGIDRVCPTLAHHDSRPAYSGRGYLAAARAWLEGRALDEDVLAERVFTCTGCGNCETVCPIGLHPHAVNAALRGELLARERAPEPIARLLDSIAAEDNPFGRPRQARPAWSSNLALDLATPGALYYPGCAAAYARPVEARAAVTVMQAAGVRVGGFADEPCCGAPARELGDHVAAAASAAALATMMDLHAGTKIVHSGLECRRQLQGLPAQTFGEWCLQALDTGRLRATPRGTPPLVAIFDGCQARDTPAAAASRAVLAKLGVSIANPDVANHGVCCGAGGGMPAMQPAGALRMARAKLAEHAAAPTIVGADVRCLAHLDAARRPGDPALATLAEFLVAHFDFGART